MNRDPARPVLVLANSLSATSEMWRDLVPAWAREHRVVSYNYVGHGTASGTSLAAADSLQAMGESLLQRLDAEGVQTFDFIGLSLGGSLGLYLASRHPERLRRVVAANCRYWAGPDGAAAWDERIRLVQEKGMDAVVQGTLDRWLTAAFSQQHSAIVARLRDMIAGTSVEGYRLAATAVRDIDLRASLGQIRCPVLLLTGDQDLAAPVAHMQALQGLVPGARLHVFERCAHMSCIEQADAFAEQVFLHLRR